MHAIFKRIKKCVNIFANYKLIDRQFFSFDVISFYIMNNIVRNRYELFRYRFV